jgi:hypothetical protein
MTRSSDMSIRDRIRVVTADLTPRVGAYIVVVNLAAAGVFAVLLFANVRVESWFAVAAFAVVAAFGERGRITLRREIAISISLLPTLFAAVLFGPLAGMVVYATSVVGLGSFPTAGKIAFFGSRALTGAFAGGSALLVGEFISSGIGRLIAAAIVAALAADAADAFFTSLTFTLRGYGSWKVAARAALPVTIASVPLYGPAVGLLAIAYRDISPWTLPLFFGPALAAQRWFLMYQGQRQLAGELKAANEQLRAANLSFARGLIATLDARDRYTAGHSAAVAIYARDIANRMGLSEAEQARAYLCGLVHDIGKIGLPAGLLEKPGALTLEERREMQRHSEIGERILANVETYAEIAGVVRHHHERIDGQGYPDGVRGDEIPVLSRIIAVADAYNAMTSDRPYRDAMPSRVARLRLAQAVETQFDTAVVAAFEAILAGAHEDYRLAQGEYFSIASPRDAAVDTLETVAI